jgi:hypothetical protein
MENGADQTIKNKNGKIPFEMTTNSKLKEYLAQNQ